MNKSIFLSLKFSRRIDVQMRRNAIIQLLLFPDIVFRSGVEMREYSRGNPLRSTRVTFIRKSWH
jgi:hypothetical protein